MQLIALAGNRSCIHSCFDVELAIMLIKTFIQGYIMSLPNRILPLAVGASGLLGLGACTSLPVTTDANPNASVGSCHTYAFAQEHVANAGQQPSAFSNPLNSDRLRAAIESNLAGRGIQKVTGREPADCVVGYAIGSRVVADDYAGWQVGYGFGWGGGWGGRYGGLGYYDSSVRNEGRITIDLFDARNRTAIWHASVNQNVADLTGPSAELKINQAASAIFAKFPVIAPSPAAAPAST
jgi:hypothetical protein